MMGAQAEKHAHTGRDREVTQILSPEETGRRNPAEIPWDREAGGKGMERGRPREIQKMN